MPNEHEPRSPGEKSPIYPPDPLVADPVVEMLVPDPSQPPTPTVALAGLLGRSAKEGYWRLYFSSTLGRYAEFKEEDVLHSVKIPREQPPFAGLQTTRVWIRQDAEIEYTRTESRRVQANSLAARWPTPGGEGQDTFEAAFFPVPTERPVAAVLLNDRRILFPVNNFLTLQRGVPKPIPEPI